MPVKSELSDLEASAGVQLFTLLLKGFELVASRRPPSDAVANLAMLLDGFSKLQPKPLATLSDAERMAKRTFNDAERYVIRRWAASYELEQSMVSAREKYQQMCERVVEDFVEIYPQFDNARVRVVHTSGNQSGTICISRKAWPRSGKSTSCGFWIENIRFEYIADEDSPPPLLSVWIQPLEEESKDVLESAKRRISAEAVSRLPKELLAKASKAFPDNGYAVGYEFIGKAELLDLLADEDSERFSKLLFQHLEMLMPLFPVLEDILIANK